MTNKSPADRAYLLLKQTGISFARDLERAGVTRTELRRLLDRGLIERVSRGLYGLPGAARTEHNDLAEVARRLPGGVICLLSALRFHGLTTQNPFEVWIAIDRKAWRPKAGHPPLRLVYLSGKSLHEGIEERDVGGVTVRVFSAAKTVADCFKFRNKIGTDVAVEALRDYRRKHPRRLEDVWRFAEMNRVARVIQPYLESVGATVGAKSARRSTPIPEMAAFLNRAFMARFCKQHGIHRLSLYGSTLKGKDRPDSDIDLLVEFEPDREPGLIALSGMEAELSSRSGGRKVDLRTAEDLSPYFREDVIRTAMVLYARR